MNHKFKIKQRIAALCMAAMICCSLFPAGAFAEALRTDADGTLIMEQDKVAVTDDSHQTEASDPDPGEESTPKSSEVAATPQSADEDTPVETFTDYTFDGAVLYTDLPDTPTGSYMGSQGLPVATGETKIGISAWPNDQLEESTDSYLSADTLNSDDLTMMAPLLEDTDYAVAPILAQVEYPADGSSLDVVLPNEVTVLDFYGAPADEATRSRLVHSEYTETSAAVMGLYVQADADFSAQLVYTAPDGSTLTKVLHVVIDRSRTMAAPFAETTDVAAYAERPTPAVTSGKITKVEKVNGTWLIWFNGEEAYCCTHGANGQPKGCPPYTYTNTSLVSADQCIPGDHYGNQYRIWGGLDQLSMDLLPDTPAVFSAEDTERISLLDFCYTIYDDTQLWLIENYPESTAAKIYLESAQALLDGAVAYAKPRGYYTYIYTPARSGWQTVALIGPEISEDETEEPKPVVQEYYASWEAPAQSASGTVDLTYGITTDKIQLKTLEKVDGATIEIEPITKSGTIDGGSWSISPAGVQTVTTSGHTNDDNYQKNGCAASASWSVHYTVSKTVDGRSGNVGPYTTKEAADAAANSERDSAVAAIQAEAQSAVNNAIGSAQAQLASLQFRYDEITIPYGFESYWGSNGSHQTITVPANSNNAYEMRNAEWSLQINIKKTDSETGNQIAGDARYEIYQWDVVTGKYQPTGGYNTYSVQRQGDGTYAVINNAAYATNDTMRHTLYYTQRNEGRFILVETKAPAGYFGDWTDIDHPGSAGTPLGKRAYYVEITADNNNSVLWLGKALDGTWTYDAYYLSYAPGYLCDEHNYYITPAYDDEGWYVEKTTFANDTAAYNGNYHIHKDNGLTESQDQVAKGNVEISKVVSSSGQSNGLELEGAGFTFYLVSDLSKVEQFDQTRTGSYTLQSILDAYINKEYDNEHPKWDFSGETQAIAKTYEVNADEIAAYNKTLTAAGDNKNGKGDGWQPTGRANEYQLAEIFSNDSGSIRVQGLSYGTYLVVETTTPHDLFQAEPFLVSIDPEQDNNPWGAMATPKDSVMKASDSYQKFTVLDEEIEVYLKITKLNTETGKPVLLPNTAFQIYWLDDNGNYRLENGKPKLVTMTDTVNGHLTKNVETFYTNEEGILTLPEKLPLGKYRIVETVGPDGFYNEWADSGNYYVDFDISTDRIYKATGDDNENSMDTLVIGENYWNEETLGKLTIRKTGNALTGMIETIDLIDPWMTGEADSDFAYTLRPLAGAEYTITAAEDIYTQDRHLDANGSRTLWYAKGDVVAVVTTGDGSADTAVFAPSRTKATYDFLSVIHDGTLGEVSVTLPLGSYHVEETKPPYGYIGTADSYDVTFVWDNQLNDVVMAKSIIKNGDSEQHFDVVRASEASAELAEQQTLGFYNDREHARVGVYKINQETGNYLAGAMFNLYTRDDIYDVDGSKLFSAGDLISTSPETVADGYTYFNCDVPIRGEWYGQSDRLDATTNSGNYFIRELRAPQGYYLNDAEMDVTFTHDGEVLQVLDNTCANKPTEMWVSKRDLTNDEELPGATLIIKDAKENIVDTWVSTDTPHRVTGLHFDEEYTLTEKRPADGYAVADDIVFRLERKTDADGHELDEADIYYLKDKKKLWIIPWEEWELLDDATVIMRDDITRVQISKVDIATGKELPGAELVIKDKDGNTVAQWVSEDKPHYIEKLPAGEYTLTEITAPNGYQIAESITFTVLPTGELQTVVMKDARIPEETPHEDTPSNTPQPTPGSTPAPAPAPASTPTATPAPMPIIPQTGDVFPFALLSTAVFGSIVGIGIFAYKRRKSKPDESEH